MTPALSQTYREVDVDRLIPRGDNPNRGHLPSIVDSIGTNGFYGACVVREHPTQEGCFEILAGEHRWRAATRHGYDQIPVIVVHDADDVRAVRIMLADNETNRRGEYDRAALREAVDALGALDGTGFDRTELARVIGEADEEEIDDEDVPEPTPDPDPGPAVDDDDWAEPAFEREYGLVVTCADEQEQQLLYDRFISEGLTVRVVAI